MRTDCNACHGGRRNKKRRDRRRDALENRLLYDAEVCAREHRPACFWVTGFSGKTPYREMRGFGGWEKQPQKALQTSSLHPRSHLVQYAAFPDMLISLLIWASDVSRQ